MASAEARGVQLKVRNLSRGKGKIVEGDEHRIGQILGNFVSNAIKFGRSVVTVSASLAGDTLTLRVEDDGAGIDPADIPKLFRDFSQLRAGSLQAGGGSGLGLVICKQLARLHGGDVGCSSGGNSTGSVFWCTVKVKRVKSTASSPRKDEEEEYEREQSERKTTPYSPAKREQRGATATFI